MSSSNASSSSVLPQPPPGFPQDYAPPALSPLPRHFILTLPYPGILNVCLNNKKLNPWSSPMTLEMTNIFKQVAIDPEVSVIILSASSGAKAFCAGLDVTESHLGEMASSSDDPAHVAFKFRRHIQEFQASLTEMELCHKPVISAVHGVVFGLGVDLMCATDIRYADKDSRFCVKEVDIALAADIGSLQRLPKIVGNDSVVRELAYTAREFGSEEAQRIGFVGRVTEGGRDGVVAAALSTALLIASKSPVAVRSSKAMLLHSRDHSVPEGLDYVATWNMAMLQSKDIPRAMQGALSKKQVKFSKL